MAKSKSKFRKEHRSLRGKRFKQDSPIHEFEVAPMVRQSNPPYLRPKGNRLSNKVNNRILKDIVNFLTNFDDGYNVSPMIDASGVINLDVQGNGESLNIVFRKDFPQEAPMILFSDGSTMIPEWEYKGSIYDSFVECYNKFALAKLNDNCKYNY